MLTPFEDKAIQVKNTPLQKVYSNYFMGQGWSHIIIAAMYAKESPQRTSYAVTLNGAFPDHLNITARLAVGRP